ncbi:type 1 glutamine amidotransferase domain-containing protein [Falsarthrobacter nasiphocae]|uniref:Intracellular protease/amidase n=1 Tax=Falsarthrobacter nasiphocae TaxID=189863 RepID=A0AAE3YHS6_9MICC|nr:type 1 glutamine amidotransferase domain-containing protein [Falsarthrobacter nasiphocae]MDR6892460.1 putative intracellular protease/amidase [Falsarthrobacter nasiphocae]
MKKVLLVLTSHDQLGDTGEKTGYFVGEAAHPWKVFTDAGYFVDFASIAGGQPPQDGVDEDDEISMAFLNDETVKASLYNTPKVSVVDPDLYDAVYLVGGHGTMFDFTKHEPLQKLVSTVYDDGGVVGAVCHGIAGLLGAELENGLRILEGKKATSFTNAEEEAAKKTEAVPYLLQDAVEADGATFKEAEPFEENVVVDENLVTGQNPASAGGVAKEMVKLITVAVRREKKQEQDEAEALRAEKDAEKAAEEADDENA